MPLGRVPPSEFDVKRPDLLTDPLLGYPAAHPEIQEMLAWLCATCAKRGLTRPLVTGFGRTRDQMEAIYLPTKLQEIDRARFANDALAIEAARLAARARFSWHCIPKAADGTLGTFRALDLRYSVWTDEARARLLEDARKRWRNAELLDHQVAGGGRHLHFGLPDPAGRPADWL